MIKIMTWLVDFLVQAVAARSPAYPSVARSQRLTCSDEYMTLKEKLLFHQVHPAKLATDLAAAVISLFFLWQYQLVIGLVTHFIPPPIASAAVIGVINLEPYKNSRLGTNLDRYMTPMAQERRLAGDLITVTAAWYQSLAMIAFRLMIILVAWTYGLLFRSR